MFQKQPQTQVNNQLGKNQVDEHETKTKELVLLLHRSFLGKYLNEEITDISYNGENLYLVDNNNGRRKVDAFSILYSNVLDLMRQIANVMGKNFNYTNPILEVSFDKYRLSAIYSSIAQSKNKPLVSFSIRIRSEILRIRENDGDLCSNSLHILLKQLINKHQSIIISGKTGSGKTELQKYLVSLIPNEDKIILIEDSYESCLKELLPFHDITTWITLNHISISLLVKTALRNQPDWLIIAETRSEEVIEMIESVSTGHPLITTIHAPSSNLVYQRMYNMGQKKINIPKEEFEKMLCSYFNLVIQMEAIKTERGIIRFIKEVTEYSLDRGRLKTKLIYSNCDGLVCYQDLSLSLAKKLNLNKRWYYQEAL